MKKLLCRSVALASIVAGAPAIAADMPVKAPIRAVPVAVASWTGFYAGVGVGFRSTKTDATVTDFNDGLFAFAAFCAGTAPFGGCVTSEPINDTAFRISPYAGFNWQVAPQWVVGVEADWGWADKTTTLAGMFYPFTSAMNPPTAAAKTFSVRTTWDASARGRIGFVANPSVMLYATGGAAWLHVESTSGCDTVLGAGHCSPVLFAPAVISHSTTKTGWTVGGGVEAMLWPNWIVRGEYRYADFGTISHTDTRTRPVGLPETFSYDLHVKTHTATLGLAYKFGSPGAPAGSAVSAFAQAFKAPPAPAASWSGLYLGLGVGTRSTRTDATITDFTDPFTTAGPTLAAWCAFLAPLGGCVTSEPINDTAFRISPYVGFNWQVARQWVVGVEGDWGQASKITTLGGMYYPGGTFITGIAADSFSVKTTWDASARARLGVLLNPSLLLYATGGAAWLHVESTSTCNTNLAIGRCGFGAFSPAVITNSTTKTGWTVGGGLEAMLWANWLARAEYRYADFGTISNINTRTSPLVGTEVVSYDLRVRTHTAMLGLAYKLDWGSPVVAKY